MANKSTKWQMVSQRAYRWNSRYIKPGQIFEAEEENIPADLRLYCVPIKSVKEEVKTTVSLGVQRKREVPPVITTTTSYQLKMRNGGEYYDVVDNKNKKINEKHLSKEEAEEFIKALEA